MSCKASLLVRCKILGLSGNTLTADHMYFRHYLRQISGTCSSAIISKTENIFLNFYCIFTIYTKIFFAFWRKRSVSQLKYFASYCFRKMWLLECWKAPVFEHPSRDTVFTGRKHSWNDHGRTFNVIFHYSKWYWVGKHLCWSGLES